jgi:hydroxyacylglutathione hydrolase
VYIDTLPVGPIRTNCYLVICKQTRASVIIDPGWDADRILAAVESRQADVKYVLNTHAHWDHIGANAQVIADTGACLALHPDDLPLLRAKGGADMWGILAQPSPEPSCLLKPGHVLEVGSLRFEVLYTPGHTPGHVSFYERGHNVIFDGDVLFRGGIGRTDLPGGNSHDLMNSIKSVLLRLSDDVTVYSGHGPVTTIGHERCDNPWLSGT